MQHINKLLPNCKIVRVKNAVAAGTTDQDTDVIDMTANERFNAVMFVALLGDVTATSVLSIGVYQNTASSTSSPTPTLLAASKTTDFTAGAADADNKLLVSEVIRFDPSLGTFLFARLKRGTANAVIDGIIAVLFDASQYPVAAHSTELARAAAAVV